MILLVNGWKALAASDICCIVFCAKLFTSVLSHRKATSGAFLPGIACLGWLALTEFCHFLLLPAQRFHGKSTVWVVTEVKACDCGLLC